MSLESLTDTCHDHQFFAPSKLLSVALQCDSDLIAASDIDKFYDLYWASILDLPKFLVCEANETFLDSNRSFTPCAIDFEKRILAQKL